MTIDLKVVAEWSAAILAVSALFGGSLKWLEGRFEKRLESHFSAVEAKFNERINKEMEDHDRDEQAHANHSNNIEFRRFAEERRHAVEELTRRIAAQDVVLGRIDAGMSNRLESIEKALERIQKAHDDAVEKGLCLYQQIASAGSRK